MNYNFELVNDIFRLANGKKHLRLMEVCGTHTVAIFRSGIRQILPENVELVSGPGCPVCVTEDFFIDKAIFYAKNPNFIVATFGDMLKVPGSRSTLANSLAEGAKIEIVYSPLDCLKLAQENPQKSVIFLAVGFETTAPTQAATILAAKSRGITNLFMLSAQKLVPPALKFLLGDESTKVDGFLLPGHVAVVLGANAFNFLANEFKIPSAIGGFEANEILTAIKSILTQIDNGQPIVANDYRSVVTNEGNLTAKKILAQVYEVTDVFWRGIGKISASGLKIRDEFADFDAERVFPIEIERIEKKSACRCGEVLRGLINPTYCPLFGKKCTPMHAIGACMVSVEGVCAAWYKYGGEKFNF